MKMMQQVAALAVILVACAGSPAYCDEVDADTFALFVSDIRQQAENGDVDAQRRLGILYRNPPRTYGYDSRVMAALAKTWLTLAAEQGDILAHVELGDLFAQYTYDQERLALAEKWYWPAAEQGNLKAQVGLGHVYMDLQHPPSGQEDDPGCWNPRLWDSIYWFRRAANQGSTEAQETLVWLDDVPAETVFWELVIASQDPSGLQETRLTAHGSPKVTADEAVEIDARLRSWKPKPE